MNVQEAVDAATRLFEQKNVESPRLSAELITAHAVRASRESILAKPKRPLSRIEELEYLNYVERRAKNEPIPYLTGHVEFYSHAFRIMRGVFIPRPETETLVARAVEYARQFQAPKVLDIGTGCGNILIAMAHELDDGEFHGTDISHRAILCAQYNVRAHELVNYVNLHEGNMFQALRGSLIRDFDVVVCNPPYVKTHEIANLPPQVKNYEPHACLDGGRDGLTFYRSIVDNVAPFLSCEGIVCLEIDPSLVSPVTELIERKAHFGTPEVTKDLSGRERVVSFTIRP